MKKQELPFIGDFVIKVIRETRRPAIRHRRQAAPAGVSVSKVSNVIANSPYSFEDYAIALRSAISTGAIVLIAKCSDFSDGGGKYCRVTYETALEADNLPAEYDFKCSNFTVDLAGNVLQERSKVPRYVYYDLRLYVPADGLPKKTQNAVVRRKGGTESRDLSASPLRRKGCS